MGDDILRIEKKKPFFSQRSFGVIQLKNKMIPGVFFFNTNVWLFAYHAE